MSEVNPRVLMPRRVAAGLGYVAWLSAIAFVLVLGYRGQIRLRLEERTREIEAAYESVTSTVAATPELLYQQIAADTFITRTMLRANTSPEAELGLLNQQLFEYLEADYRRLARLDLRQLHFHLRDNRSFLRFHRPDRYGDDLTAVRSTVRAANEHHVPAYGFEEGRIFNAFRYVYPVFHEGVHVGSVEASMSYKAILSRMRTSRPMVFDFILSQDVIETRVFEEEQHNYQSSCFSTQFARETSFEPPDTTTTLDVGFDCIIREGRLSAELSAGLEDYQATTLPFMVDGVPIALSLLPIQNYENENVAFILGYSRFDEMLTLRRSFLLIGLTLVTLSTAILAMFLRVTQQRERVIGVSKDLQKTIQAKDRFFSIVAHDLRGPVGALAGLGAVLKEELQGLEGIPLSTYELAQIIADGAENSSQLLQDLLDWSRSQRGDIGYEPVDQPLYELVDSQFAVLRRAAAEKSLTLSNRTAATRVYADEYMIKTVIRNLVANAVKFTPDGGLIVVSSTEDAETVTVSVTDTGIGMSEQQQLDVFDFSVKSSTKGTRAEPGTGLGLTVCREFIQRHGGSISIESELGVGTTFHLHLPRPDRGIHKS